MIIGSIDIEAAAIDPDGIARVEFYIDDDLKMNDTAAPYNWTWDEKTFLKFRYTIKAIVYDNIGNRASDEITVWKFF